jgi:DNA (cytosine-5)-methyltransferase 1
MKWSNNMTHIMGRSLFNMDVDKKKSLKAIDLFAGIGGIRLGFERAFGKKIDFVFASEIDKYARETYYANFGEEPFGDITEIDEKNIPPFDILLAGFPCQAFSVAGHRKGFEDTRGTLFFDVMRIAAHHKPKVIFLENVKGLVGHDKGKTFKIILETLKELGYFVNYQVLNAKDYGVPQNRQRIYIVCFLENDITFEFPQPVEQNIKVGDILDDDIDDKYTISDKLWAGHQRRKIEHKEKGNGFGYSIFNQESKYTSTISARYYKDGSEILIEQKNKNPRKLTPREACRLQGFPNDFRIRVSDVQAYKQFGNSVSVPVIEAISKNIFIQIKKEKIDEN